MLGHPRLWGCWVLWRQGALCIGVASIVEAKVLGRSIGLARERRSHVEQPTSQYFIPYLRYPDCLRQRLPKVDSCLMAPSLYFPCVSASIFPSSSARRGNPNPAHRPLDALVPIGEDRNFVTSSAASLLPLGLVLCRRRRLRLLSSSILRLGRPTTPFSTLTLRL